MRAHKGKWLFMSSGNALFFQKYGVGWFQNLFPFKIFIRFINSGERRWYWREREWICGNVLLSNLNKECSHCYSLFTVILCIFYIHWFSFLSFRKFIGILCGGFFYLKKVSTLFSLTYKNVKCHLLKISLAVEKQIYKEKRNARSQSY